MSTRKPIAFVVARVRFPLYEGDVIDRDSWDDFIYEEPGVTERGELAVCRRDCETLESKVVQS